MRGQRVLEGAGRQPASFASARPGHFTALTAVLLPTRPGIWHARHEEFLGELPPATTYGAAPIAAAVAAAASSGRPSSKHRLCGTARLVCRENPAFFNALEQRAACPSSTASGAVSLQHDRAVKAGMARLRGMAPSSAATLSLVTDERSMHGAASVLQRHCADVCMQSICTARALSADRSTSPWSGMQPLHMTAGIALQEVLAASSLASIMSAPDSPAPGHGEGGRSIADRMLTVVGPPPGELSAPSEFHAQGQSYVLTAQGLMSTTGGELQVYAGAAWRCNHWYHWRLRTLLVAALRTT